MVFESAPNTTTIQNENKVVTSNEVPHANTLIPLFKQKMIRKLLKSHTIVPLRERLTSVDSN